MSSMKKSPRLARPASALTLDGAHVLQAAPLTISLRVLADGGTRRIVRWMVRNPGPSAFRGVLRLTIAWPEGFQKPWLLVPGFFYGENRRANEWRPKLYPRFDPACSAPAAMTSSWWDFAADRTSSPLVYLHEGERFFAVASDPHVAFSKGVTSEDPEPQVAVGFGSRNGDSGWTRFSWPACEEPFAYANGVEAAPSIRRCVIPRGGWISGVLRWYAGKGPRSAYRGIIEDYHRAMAARHPAAAMPETIALVRDGARGILDGHYEETKNYFVYSRAYDPVIEQIGNSRGITMEWHQMLTGFVNGFPICHALFRAADLTGDPRPMEIARRVADRICREGVSPSGFFWADYTPRTVTTPLGEIPNPLFAERQNLVPDPSLGGRNEWGSGWLSGKTRVHSRTISDACVHLADMILHDMKRGGKTEALLSWRAALRKNLQAAMDLQIASGSYGQHYDAVERTILKKEGCGGLPWISALLRARKIWADDAPFVARIERSVRRAADAYAAHVEQDNIWGAPEDNDSPTSEDGMNALVAYAELYETFGEKHDLTLARRAADWMLTFRKTYNQILPPDSLMGRYGLRSRGGDFASAANNHLHVFGVLCTRHLCRLARWTKNASYREQAREHWAFACQYLSRVDGMYNGFRGAMAEQFYWTNWGSWGGRYPVPRWHLQKGNMAPFTAIWCLAVLLLAAPDAIAEFAPTRAARRRKYSDRSPSVAPAAPLISSPPS